MGKNACRWNAAIAKRVAQRTHRPLCATLSPLRGEKNEICWWRGFERGGGQRAKHRLAPSPSLSLSLWPLLLKRLKSANAERSRRPSPLSCCNCRNFPNLFFFSPLLQHRASLFVWLPLLHNVPAALSCWICIAVVSFRLMNCLMRRSFGQRLIYTRLARSLDTLTACSIVSLD